MRAWGDPVELSGEPRSALVGRERAYQKVRAQRERMINDRDCQGNFETRMPNINGWSAYLQIFLLKQCSGQQRCVTGSFGGTTNTKNKKKIKQQLGWRVGRTLSSGADGDTQGRGSSLGRPELLGARRNDLPTVCVDERVWQLKSAIMRTLKT